MPFLFLLIIFLYLRIIIIFVTLILFDGEQKEFILPHCFPPSISKEVFFYTGLLQVFTNFMKAPPCPSTGFQDVSTPLGCQNRVVW
jgi:hypothetical protein